MAKEEDDTGGNGKKLAMEYGVRPQSGAFARPGRFVTLYIMSVHEPISMIEHRNGPRDEVEKIRIMALPNAAEASTCAVQPIFEPILDAIFVTHPAPEDNEFAFWISSPGLSIELLS